MWRKHENHKAETTAIKAALKRAGIRAKVGHGTGTAWAWLKIEAVAPRDDHHVIYDRGLYIMTDRERTSGRVLRTCKADCPACAANRLHRTEILRIVREVTGRGEGGSDFEVTLQTPCASQVTGRAK